MTLAQAVAELGKMGNFGRAIAKASEVGNLLASLIQQEHELKQKLEHVRAEVAAAVSARDRATAEAIEVRSRAQHEAEDIASAARDRAASLVHAAKEDVAAVQALVAAARTELEDAVAQRNAAAGETNAARAALDQIRERIEEGKAEARRRFE